MTPDRDQIQDTLEKMQEQLNSIRQSDVSLSPIYDEQISQIQADLDQDTLNLLILGDFNRGKSTLLNTFLRQEVLKMSPVPYPMLNEIKGGETEEIAIYDNEEISKEISINELSELKLSKGAAGTHKVTLNWPLSIFQGDINIIEYPSFADWDTESEILPADMQPYLSIADIIVFVLTCDSLFSLSEQKLAEQIIASTNQCPIYFICNRLDRIPMEEQQDIISYGHQSLLPFTEDGRIFFLSAKSALDGYTRDDTEAVQKSGYLDFELKLTEFANNNRAQIQAHRKWRQLCQIIDSITQELRAFRMVLETKQDNLETTDETQKSFAKLESLHKRLAEHILPDFIKLNQDLIESHVGLYLQKLTAKVEEWVKSYLAQNEANAPLRFTQESRQQMIEDLTAYVLDRANEDLKVWREGELIDFLNRRVNVFQQEIEPLITEFKKHASLIAAQSNSLNLTINTNVTLLQTENWIIPSPHGEFPEDNDNQRPGFEPRVSSALIKGALVAVGGTITLSLLGIGWFLAIPVSVLAGLFLGRKLFSNISRDNYDQVVENVEKNVREAISDQSFQVAQNLNVSFLNSQESIKIRLDTIMRNIAPIVQYQAVQYEHEQNLLTKELERYNRLIDNLNSLEKLN